LGNDDCDGWGKSLSVNGSGFDDGGGDEEEDDDDGGTRKDPSDFKESCIDDDDDDDDDDDLCWWFPCRVALAAVAVVVVVVVVVVEAPSFWATLYLSRTGRIRRKLPSISLVLVGFRTCIHLLLLSGSAVDDILAPICDDDSLLSGSAVDDILAPNICDDDSLPLHNKQILGIPVTWNPP